MMTLVGYSFALMVVIIAIIAWHINPPPWYIPFLKRARDFTKRVWLWLKGSLWPLVKKVVLAIFRFCKTKLLKLGSGTLWKGVGKALGIFCIAVVTLFLVFKLWTWLSGDQNTGAFHAPAVSAPPTPTLTPHLSRWKLPLMGFVLCVLIAGVAYRLFKSRKEEEKGKQGGPVPIPPAPAPQAAQPAQMQTGQQGMQGQARVRWWSRPIAKNVLRFIVAIVLVLAALCLADPDLRPHWLANLDINTVLATIKKNWIIASLAAVLFLVVFGGRYIKWGMVSESGVNVIRILMGIGLTAGLVIGLLAWIAAGLDRNIWADIDKTWVWLVVGLPFAGLTIALAKSSGLRIVGVMLAILIFCIVFSEINSASRRRIREARAERLSIGSLPRPQVLAQTTNTVDSTTATNMTDTWTLVIDTKSYPTRIIQMDDRAIEFEMAFTTRRGTPSSTHFLWELQRPFGFWEQQDPPAKGRWSVGRVGDHFEGEVICSANHHKVPMQLVPH